jgi:hypothetical protein
MLAATAWRVIVLSPAPEVSLEKKTQGGRLSNLGMRPAMDGTCRGRHHPPTLAAIGRRTPTTGDTSTRDTSSMFERCWTTLSRSRT